MNLQLKIIAYHTLGITFFVGQDVWIMHVMGTPVTYRGYISFVLEILVFYTNLLWVVPYLFYNRKWLIGWLHLGLIIALYTLLRGIAAYTQPTKASFLQFLFSSQNLLFTLWRLNYALGLSFSLGLFRYVQKRRQERHLLQLSIAQADAERARIENAMVQMQLSPHMLLNGLSYIKAYTEEQLPQVGEAINTMANMLRYTLTDIRTTKMVRLQAELEQVQNRIRFQQQLSGRELCLEFSHPAVTEGILIPPYLIVTIADNVLKYGSLYNPNQPALIQVTYSNGQLTVITQNDKAPNTVGGTGMGLKSIQQILAYYYPRRHCLHISNTQNQYLLTLTIQV